MKNTICTSILLIFIISLCSCTTLMPFSMGKSIAFNDIECIENAYVELSSVNVIIDQVPDKEIANQIELLAANYLNAMQNQFSQKATKEILHNKAEPEKKINLKIHAVQRSYLQGTSMVNSIFFSFDFSAVEEISGKSVCVINEFTSGEETIYSSKVQHKFLNKALNEYFKQKAAKKEK